jgi:hypothetical protein
MSLFATALTGCVIVPDPYAGLQWKKYGGTQADFDRDLGACKAKVLAAFPVKSGPRLIASAEQIPRTKTCTTTRENRRTVTTSCQTTPAEVVPAKYENVRDINEDNRPQQVLFCMYDKGYEWVDPRVADHS